MNKEFEDLYSDWYLATCFQSSRDFKHEPGFIALLEWSKEHKKEAIDSIKEILLKEPDFVVYILDELFDHPLSTDGYVSLEAYCNFWLILLDYYENGENKLNTSADYYKDWRAYQEYMKDNFIPYNCFTENDPNITLEEFKMGKRNNPNYSRPIQMVQLKEENFKNN